jgi:hypothetical protein
VEVDFDGANVSPIGDERTAFSAARDVNGEDWGLPWNVALETGGVLVGKKVRIEPNVETVGRSDRGTVAVRWDRKRGSHRGPRTD